jgi:hypothetical protein
LVERSLARGVWACGHETGERIDQSLEMRDRRVELSVAGFAIEQFAGARASHLALGIRDAFEGIDRGPTCPRVASARHRHVATSPTLYLRDDRARSAFDAKRRTTILASRRGSGNDAILITVGPKLAADARYLEHP